MSELFVLQTPVVELVLRAAVIYFFLLLVMRLIGRHEFGQLTPFDLILLLIISESISEALTAGDDSLLAGLVSASTLLGLSVLVSIGQYRSKRIRAIVSPEALKVIENGRVIERSLRRELMTRDDLIERLALFECSSSGRPVHRTPGKGYRRYRRGAGCLHRERRRHLGAHLRGEPSAPGGRGRRGGEEGRVTTIEVLRRKGGTAVFGSLAGATV